MSAAELPRSIAATLTPSGRGAVAVIGIRGPLAEETLARHFERPDRVLTSFVPGHPNNTPLRRILYGTWQSNAEQIGPREDVVLTRLETHWELGCHGGAIAAMSILRDLAAAGIETVSWQEWLTATAKNRLLASAAQALAAAQSPAAALALLRAAPLTEQALRELLDCFSEQRSGSSLRSSPATSAPSESLRSQSTPAAMTQAVVERLLSTARWAKHLTSPWHIVLAGLPNAGKSSLLNALVGYERAIVFAEPGTTRDVVTAAAAYEGWRWELRDTAGLRATDDSLEALGIERTTAMLAASDVTVLVIDGTRPWSESESLRRAHPNAIVVRNKSDLWEAKPLWEGEAPAEPLVTRASSPWNLRSELGQDAQATTAPFAVSAVTNQGLEELRAAIHARLDLPVWDSIGACVWDAALEHDLLTLQRVLRDDPAALPAILCELKTWIE
jgi:tRNA modification GTPase